MAAGEAAVRQVRPGEVRFVQQAAASVQPIGLDEAQDRPPPPDAAEEQLVVAGRDFEAGLIQLAACRRRLKVSKT